MFLLLFCSLNLFHLLHPPLNCSSSSLTMSSPSSSPPPPSKRFSSFEAFYPFYLKEHSKAWTRRLHFIGTTLGMFIAVGCVAKGAPEKLWLGLVAGYGFAWISHAFIERNKPATFQYPLFSFRGDFRLWSEMIQGKRWTDETK